MKAELDCWYLSTISGVDKGETYEILYHFGDTTGSIHVRTQIPKADPRLPSICGVIPGAVLYERELQDMFGIVVENHPGSAADAHVRRLAGGELPPPQGLEVRPAGRGDPRRQEMKFNIPIGPQHPALKEPISIRLTVEGEVIRDADLRLGYNHRGVEKLAEEKSWIQNIYLTERICGICSHSHATCFVQGVEKLLEIVPPRRGVYLRYLVSELERIHSHLLWLGVAGHEAGFDTFFMYTWRDREVVMDLLEMISGNRVHYAINTLGGVRRDIDEALRTEDPRRLRRPQNPERILFQDRGRRNRRSSAGWPGSAA